MFRVTVTDRSGVLYVTEVGTRGREAEGRRVVVRVTPETDPVRGRVFES